VAACTPLMGCNPFVGASTGLDVGLIFRVRGLSTVFFIFDRGMRSMAPNLLLQKLCQHLSYFWLLSGRNRLAGESVFVIGNSGPSVSFARISKPLATSYSTEVSPIPDLLILVPSESRGTIAPDYSLTDLNCDDNFGIGDSKMPTWEFHQGNRWRELGGL
jgi:hypothetical protein